MRYGTSDDVHVGDAGVMGEVGSLCSCTLHDPQQFCADQWLQCREVDAHHAGHYRVELEQHCPVAGHDLVQHVEGRDGGDVAGAEHESNTSGDCRSKLTEARRGHCLGRGDARLEPHFRAESVE